MARPKKLKTPAQVREEFRLQGASIAEWAADNGFAPKCVYDVLQRRRMGDRGEAHRAAVALGIKEGEAQTVN